MGDKSKIEWTDATWNPITGCTKVSDGCKHCYAERLFPRTYGKQTVYRQYKEVRGGNPPGLPVKRAFTDVVCHPDRLDHPLRWRRPRRIFVNSMSDLFHEDVLDNFIDQIFAVMALSPDHTFQVLTKRPERMAMYLCDEDGKADLIETWWPPNNVWLGVSAENQKTFDERVEHLAAVPAAVRFVSLEPLLGEIECGNAFDDPLDGSPYGKIDWVIAGGESGPKARPSHPGWFRSLRDQCTQSGVPFFFKQWGQWLPEGQQNSAGVLCEDAYIFDEDEFPGTVHFWPDHTASVRVRKKELGRLLDGKLWDEYPK